MIPLNTIQVPKPCGENWDAMDGDAQRRFCAGCGCHVHDLSAMTSTQAQALLDNSDGRLCVRFQTRSDGTVLTQDTIPAVERPILWPRRLAAAASWVLALALTGLGLTAQAETAPHKASSSKPQAAKPAPKRPSVRSGRIAPVRQPQPPTNVRQGQPTTSEPSPQIRPGQTMGKPLMPPPMMGAVAVPPKK